MKKITCIQQYVIDNLIKDERLSTNSLLDAISEVCSNEQFDTILSILIKTTTLYTTKVEKENTFNVNMYIPESATMDDKFKTIKVIKKLFDFGLKEARDYVDSCIGSYQILPRIITQEEVDVLIKALEPYNVSISVINLNKLMQQKYCIFTVRISNNFVGLIFSYPLCKIGVMT